MIVFLAMVLSVVVGAFWIFTMIIGFNGVTGPKGGYLVWSHFAVLVVMLTVSGFASAWLERLLVQGQGWSPWLAGLAICVGVPLLLYGLLLLCSLVLILIIGVK